MDSRYRVAMLGVMGLGTFIVSFLISYALLNAVITHSDDSQSQAIVTSLGEYQGTAFNPPVELVDFSMMSSTEEEVHLSDFNGQFILTFFGYTGCPDICPTTLLEFRQVKANLGVNADKVDFIFISVDAPRDTPQVLADYIARYDSEFLALSATDETLAQIGPDFGLYYKRHIPQDDEKFYFVDHTSHSFLINDDGQVIRSFSYGTDAQVIAGAIQAHLDAS